MSENRYSTSPTTYLPHNLTTYPPHHFTTYPLHHLPTSPLHHLPTSPLHHLPTSPPTHFKTYHLPTSPPHHLPTRSPVSRQLSLTLGMPARFILFKPPPPLNTLQQQTHMCCTFSTCLLVLTQQEHTHSYSNCTYTCTYKHTQLLFLEPRNLGFGTLQWGGPAQCFLLQC